MDSNRYEQIINFLKQWVKEEGLCRFCDIGRMCDWSRKGREECGRYVFVNEMDCFHLWIACVDEDNIRFRKGYNYAEDYPWKKDPPERDIPYNAQHIASNPTDKDLEVQNLELELRDLWNQIEKKEAKLKKLEEELN